jgi:anthranilate synthase/aminodeoxychorismate synthase-like glutamine amidotransferase
LKIFLLDNYDSFTYNIVHTAQKLGETPCVKRNTEVSLQFLEDYSPERIIISPGPMRPENHAFIFDMIKKFYKEVPILGICLGMQAVNAYFGGAVVKAPAPVHGKTSLIYHSGDGIFKGVPSPFISARYHSLAVSDIPEILKATAFTADNVTMALSHKRYPVFGVQFHPESYLSFWGGRILKNFFGIK